MTDKRLKEIISASNCKDLRECSIRFLEEARKKGDVELINKVKKSVKRIEESLKDDLNYKAMAIAAYVRANIEDFHREHLSDGQMKELNPLIRNAVYTFLVDERKGNFIDMSARLVLNLAGYWEDCVYGIDSVDDIESDE